MLGSTENKHIAIDGKTLRKSFDKANEQSAIHTLNAFIVDNLTVIRQEFGYKKDSEITMIPKLLSKINIKDSTITIDAIGCQKDRGGTLFSDSMLECNHTRRTICPLEKPILQLLRQK